MDHAESVPGSGVGLRVGVDMIHLVDRDPDLGCGKQQMVMLLLSGAPFCAEILLFSVMAEEEVRSREGAP